MKTIVCFGELLLRLSTNNNQTFCDMGPISPFIGGAEANVASGLSNFGHFAKMVSVIPENDLGTAAKQALLKNNVDCSNIIQSKGRMGIYFLTIGAGLRPSDIIYDRANSAFADFDFETINWANILKGTDLFHVSGVTAALGDRAFNAALTALKMAKQIGVKCAYDCNFRPKLWENWSKSPSDHIYELMSHSNIIFGDRRDFSVAFNSDFTDETQAANAAFEKFPNLEIITSTPRIQTNATDNQLGGLLHTRGETYKSAHRVINGIIDRIGSGDAFAAGLLSKLLEDKPLQESLDFGVAAAALKHYQIGDLCQLRHSML